MRLPYYRILEYMAFRLAVYRPVLPESKSRWCSFGNTWRNIHLLAFFFFLMVIRTNLLHASWMISHMQLCSPCVSQYGTHLPTLHCPLSWHIVPSDMAGDFGHSACPPEQRASCSHVAYCASRHLTPDGIYWQFWQHGEFLSLQTAPWLRRSLQFLSQQASLSSVPRRPASHCSSPSTRRLPQKDSSGSEKHRPDLAWRTLRMERSEQGENFYVKRYRKREDISGSFQKRLLLNPTLLFTSYPLTEYVYIKKLPPCEAAGEHSGISGSCSEPQLWPNSWAVTRSASRVITRCP